jgi:hypothetical protein
MPDYERRQGCRHYRCSEELKCVNQRKVRELQHHPIANLPKVAFGQRNRPEKPGSVSGSSAVSGTIVVDLNRTRRVRIDVKSNKRKCAVEKRTCRRAKFAFHESKVCSPEQFSTVSGTGTVHACSTDATVKVVDSGQLVALAG